MKLWHFTRVLYKMPHDDPNPSDSTGGGVEGEGAEFNIQTQLRSPGRFHGRARGGTTNLKYFLLNVISLVTKTK
jgi:hypothetical protein